MCLNLEKDAVKLIAEEDIVCYKFLNLVNTPISDNEIINAGVKTGDVFSGIAVNLEVEGVINIVNHEIFLLTNDENLNGCGQHTFGYNYSWRLDGKIQELVINEQKFSKKEFLGTIYRHFSVEMGKTYTSELDKIDNRIEKGLHSFQEVNEYLSSILVKCIIPKGSSYYIGKHDNQVSYASDTLTYVEII